MQPDEVEARVARTLAQVGADTARLLLAVSGGSDSMALLGVLGGLAAGRVAVVHVQHGMRPEAEADADLVAATCRALGVPHRRIDAPPSFGEPRTETAARIRRLAALGRAARDLGCPWVLLGQHLDDDVETSLLHLLRGHAGDRAWAGVPTVRPLDGTSMLLRPFLGGERSIDRAVLWEVRRAQGLPYAEDASNRDPSVPRSALRGALVGARGPLAREALVACQRQARRRLARRLGRIVEVLAEGLVPHGHGASLSAEAFETPRDDSDDAWDTELLRLLGGCLARPREIVSRNAARAAWRRALAASDGWATLAATPTPLRARVTSDGLLLPDEALAPGNRLARPMRALARTPLFV